NNVNTANVNLNSGTVLFAGGFTQTAGTTWLLGGNLNGPAGVTLNGGTLRGNGTVTGNVNNSAVVSPGLSPGMLTINGNYSQSSSGTLSVEIGGTAPGTGYDRLAVTGNATLDGTLSASFFGGFIPTDNDVFDVVTYGSRSGNFASEILPTFPGGGTLIPTYEPAAYRLTAQATQADLGVTQTTSGPVLHNQNATFTVTVTNNGPDPTGGVTLTDTLSGGTLVSAISTLGTCSGSAPIVCNIGTLTAGQSAVVTITVNANSVGTISNSATVSGLESDPNTANDATGTANVTVSPSADLGVSISESGDPVISNGAMTYTVSVSQSGPDAAASPNVALSIANGAIVSATSASFTCSGAGASANCVLAGSAAPGTRMIAVNVQAPAADGVMSLTATASSSTGDPNPANNSQTENTAVTQVANLSITKSGPESAEVGDTITYTITVSNNSVSNAADVVVDDATPANLTFTGTSGDCTNGFPCALGTLPTGASATIQATYVVGDGAKGTTVVNTATVSSTSDPDAGNNSASAATQIGGTTECIPLVTPLARVVGQATSAKTYDVEWDLVAGATRYEVQEAANAQFDGAITIVEQGLSHAFKHDVTEATAFFYRVRALSDCDDSASAYSPTIRVVIIPLPPKEQENPSVNVPAGSTELIVQQVFIPGEEGQTLFFTATTDRPWLSVTPPSGVLPPEGMTLHVMADPRTLPNGTFTATVIVTIEGAASSRVRSHGTTTSIPITVNLVTPVTPKPSKEAASQHAIIVPAVGHLDGQDSHWQSDVRITNAGFRNYKYRLTFTPAGGTALGVKETNVTVDAGATIALDDIVKNWFGQGSLGDGVSGMLEILPLEDAENAAKVTVASSCTYNVTANGTLGQFIPAIPFPSFIGRAAANALPTILGLQQIAQTTSYRTNVGIVEGSGRPVQALINVFNAQGTRLLSLPTSLVAGQQLQLNGLLAANNLLLDDGRIEVQVTGGDGKITAYASV
ncbi:MAG TPA: DUF11 domain-containing protein, partial [Thermoanaerobaculia bacterium]|nr:DUF11 domain-containing protein [Thermoanaerobaculia bacterium]